MANDVKHIHPVPDNDPSFRIDPETRTITQISAEKLLLIQGDHNSERYSFEIPIDVDGHDMSKCNLVQVHFINIFGNDPSKTSAGIYEVDDLQIDPDDKELVRLSWLISRVATTHVGTLNFVVRFACTSKYMTTKTNDDGTTVEVEETRVDYSWSTSIFSGVIISTGIDNSNAVVEQYYDVLEKWYGDLMAAGETGSKMVDAAVEEGIEKLNSTGAVVANAVRQDIDDYTIEKKKQLTVDTLKLGNVIVQETGSSTEKVMSQVAVTNVVTDLEGEVERKNTDTLALVNERIAEMTESVARLTNTLQPVEYDQENGCYSIDCGSAVKGLPILLGKTEYLVKQNSDTIIKAVVRYQNYASYHGPLDSTSMVPLTDIPKGDETLSYIFIPDHISYTDGSSTGDGRKYSIRYRIDGRVIDLPILNIPEGYNAESSASPDLDPTITVTIRIYNATGVFIKNGEVPDFTITSRGISDIRRYHSGEHVESGGQEYYDYTIVFTDGTTKSFTVGSTSLIRDIAKISPEGSTVDEYEITYGPTSIDGGGLGRFRFTVTNGAGPYIVFSEHEGGHVNRTADFHSTWTPGMNYMGIATGPEAPIDPDSYAWVRIADTVNVTQTTGNSEALAASQKLVTDLTNAINFSLETHAKELDSLKSEASRANKRLTNIEDSISGDLIVIDSTAVMVKDVPENTSSFAEVVEIGGLTRKCENLISFPYLSTVSNLNGVSSSVHENGTITFSGKCTSGWTFILCEKLMSAGNYYLADGVTETGINFLAYDMDNSAVVSWEGAFSLTKDTMVRVYYLIADTFDGNCVVYPMLNSGETALPYEPYFSGLRSAPVYEVVSEGVNLTTAKDVYKDVVAYREMIVDNRNCIRMTSGKTIACTPFAFKENTQYTVSFYTKSENFGGATGGNIVFTFFYTDGTNSDVRSSHLSTDWHLITLTSAAGKTVKKIGVSIAQYQVYNYIDVDTFMLNKGTTALPYKPYIKRTLPVIPKIKSHDTWGISLGDVHDSVDFVNMQYTQRVGVVDLGTLEWALNNANVFQTTSLGTTISNKLLCANYKFVGGVGGNSQAYNTGDKTISYYTNDKRIYIRDDSYTDAATFKAAMSGVMLYYDLAEPVISALPPEFEVLKDYGVGIPDTDYFNRIRWRYDEPTDKWVREYEKRVGMVVLGTLDWTVIVSDSYAYTGRNYKPSARTMVASLPTQVTSLYVDPYGAVRVHFTSGAFTSAAQLKAALSGVMIYYELATPEITDISHLLPVDNLIGVQGNGSMTAVNEFGYDVPNTIRYQLNKTEVTT